MFQKSRNISDTNVEAQPLWEYPGTAQSEPIPVAEVDFLNTPKNISSHGTRFGLIHIITQQVVTHMLFQ